MKRLLILSSYISLVVIFFSILTIGFWAFYPYRVLEFGPENGKLLQNEVKAGDYLSMYQDFCKYIDIVSEIDRQFIDSIIYQVPKSLNRRPLGCFKRTEQIYIPKALPPGRYYISTTITFHINPIRHITMNVKTATFKVTE